MPTPIEQLLSQTVYATDGTTTDWNFSFSGGYLDKAHVKARTDTPQGFRTEITVTPGMLVGQYQLRVTPALAAGDVLTIYRNTPKDLPLVDFTDESGFSEIALDTMAKQAIFVAAETTDTVNTSPAQAADASASAAAGSAVAAAASAVAAAASAALATTYTVGGAVNAAPAKAVPVDADRLPLVDSASGFTLRQLTWANIKAALSGVFVTLATLASNAGAGIVGFIAAGAGAVATTAQAKLRESVSVKDFGAVGDDVANDTAAFALALNFCKTSGRGLRIPGGAYLLDSGVLDFAGQGLAIVGEGKPTLHFAGTGRGMELNGGVAGAGVGNMRVENLLIKGGPNITDGFYKKGVFRSVFRNIEVRECNNNAFTILHGVSNQYDTLKFSTNEASQTTTPTSGLVLNNNGVGYYTADCTFINTIMEGFAGRGCNIVDGQGNVFVGGTLEAVTTGLEIAAASNKNKFIGLWCEANTTRDLELYGNANSFSGCNFQSASSGNTVEIITGDGNYFDGGFIRVVNMQGTSRDTTFSGCGLADNVGLGFQGTGTHKRFGCSKYDTSLNVTGTFADFIGEPKGTWTPRFDSSGGGTQGAVTVADGTYCVVGKLCYVQGFMSISKGTLGAGAVSISGLPFASRSTANDYQYIHMAEWDNINLSAGYTTLVIRVAPGTTTGTLLQSGDSVASATVAVADFPAPMGIRFSGIYEIE